MADFLLYSQSKCQMQQLTADVNWILAFCMCVLCFLPCLDVELENKCLAIMLT